jgi:hypothetical protein
MDESAFFRDIDVPLVCVRWQEAFSRLNAHLFAGGTVVWPSDGVGTGRAELKKRAPGSLD